MSKEENAIVLDFLPYGYPLENKRMPLAQAIGTTGLTLLQLVPRRGEKFEIGEVAYIGDGKRDKVQYILGRCPREKLTETAKVELMQFVEKVIVPNPGVKYRVTDRGAQLLQGIESVLESLWGMI